MNQLTTFAPAPTITSDIVDFIRLNYDAIFDGLDIAAGSKATYKSNGKDFLNFIQSNSVHLDTFRNYKAHLLSRTDIQGDSKKYKLMAAKAILLDLYHRRRLLPVDITAGTKGIKTASGHKKDGLNEGEVLQVKTFINGINDDRKRTRLKALYYLLAYQGLRQFEALNITYEDLYFNDCQLSIMAKGVTGKQRIDLHPDSCQALKEYCSTWNIKSGYLFTSVRGTSKGSRLTERGFRKMIEGIFDTLGIDRSAHGFRHFFVTTMLEATNGNIGVVKMFSRHKTVQALMNYDDRKRKKEMLPSYYAAFANV